MKWNVELNQEKIQKKKKLKSGINLLENEHQTIPQNRRALCSPELLMKKYLLLLQECH